MASVHLLTSVSGLLAVCDAVFGHRATGQKDKVFTLRDVRSSKVTKIPCG